MDYNFERAGGTEVGYNSPTLPEKPKETTWTDDANYMKESFKEGMNTFANTSLKIANWLESRSELQTGHNYRDEDGHLPLDQFIEKKTADIENNKKAKEDLVKHNGVGIVVQGLGGVATFVSNPINDLAVAATPEFELGGGMVNLGKAFASETLQGAATASAEAYGSNKGMDWKEVGKEALINGLIGGGFHAAKLGYKTWKGVPEDAKDVVINTIDKAVEEEGVEKAIPKMKANALDESEGPINLNTENESGISYRKVYEAIEKCFK